MNKLEIELANQRWEMLKRELASLWALVMAQGGDDYRTGMLGASYRAGAIVTPRTGATEFDYQLLADEIACASSPESGKIERAVSAKVLELVAVYCVKNNVPAPEALTRYAVGVLAEGAKEPIEALGNVVADKSRRQSDMAFVLDTVGRHWRAPIIADRGEGWNGAKRDVLRAWCEVTGDKRDTARRRYEGD